MIDRRQLEYRMTTAAALYLTLLARLGVKNPNASSKALGDVFTRG